MHWYNVEAAFHLPDFLTCMHKHEYLSKNIDPLKYVKVFKFQIVDQLSLTLNHLGVIFMKKEAIHV